MQGPLCLAPPTSSASLPCLQLPAPHMLPQLHQDLSSSMPLHTLFRLPGCSFPCLTFCSLSAWKSPASTLKPKSEITRLEAFFEFPLHTHKAALGTPVFPRHLTTEVRVHPPRTMGTLGRIILVVRRCLVYSKVCLALVPSLDAFLDPPDAPSILPLSCDKRHLGRQSHPW